MKFYFPLTNKLTWQIINAALIITAVFLSYNIFLFITKKYDPTDLSDNLADKSKENREIKQEIAQDEGKCLDCVQRQIDGMLVPVAKANLAPIGIMIENHIDSRPPAGLSRASVVYEAEAEGGITRFLAIYDTGEKIDKIGPVRSVRSYYIDWAAEWSVPLAHCGGSPDALARMKTWATYDLDEFFNSTNFWRDASRPKPHNIYTSTDRLQQYLDRKKITEANFIPLEFKTEATSSAALNSKITIHNWLPGFLVEWQYDKTKNAYIRHMDGKPHQDENGDQITAKNIILQTVGAKIIDESKRLEMYNIGKGKITFCQDGVCKPGTWQKKSSAARTKYLDMNGENFKFNPGATWIEVMNYGTKADIE